MDINAIQNVRAFATRHQLQLAERLGSGIHGIVHVAESKSQPAKTAIKAHYSPEPYLRERQVYEHLAQIDVSEVLGFYVPQLVRFDDDLQIIEMTVVTRPFVLDFAGAFLGARPEFSEEIWSEWEAGKREQFGANWQMVQAVMNAFENMDVYLVDISPSNIAFLD